MEGDPEVGADPGAQTVWASCAICGWHRWRAGAEVSQARWDLGWGGGGGLAPSVPQPGITSKSRQKGCSRAGERGEVRDGFPNRRSTFGKGMTWVPSGGQDHLGLETTFLSFFFNLFVLYRTLRQSVSSLPRAAGDRLVFSGSVHIECIRCCRNEPRPRVSSSPGVSCLAGQFSRAGGSPGDLAKNCEFGLIGPEVCGHRSSA